MIAIAPSTNSVAYHSAMRRPKVPANAGLWRPRSATEHVPDAADRVQQLLLERTIDLLAQAAHEHVDDVGLGIEVVLPHVRQNHRLRNDSSGVAHQVLEQRELAGTKVDCDAATGHATGEQI